MKQCMAGIAFALVALLVFAPVASAQSKWVRGTIVSVAGDTLVVKVAGNDMTFKVDKSTQLTARGAGKAQKAAEAKGEAGVKFADFAKAGDGVEVHYKEVGGVLTAIEVHSGLTPTEGKAPAAEATGGSARGTITAISNASISVKGDAQDWTFTVDPKTLVLGTGMGTITKQFKEQGKSPTISDLLGVNDRVVVYFKEAGGVVRASEIRVIAKAAK